MKRAILPKDSQQQLHAVTSEPLHRIQVSKTLDLYKAISLKYEDSILPRKRASLDIFRSNSE